MFEDVMHNLDQNISATEASQTVWSRKILICKFGFVWRYNTRHRQDKNKLLAPSLQLQQRHSINKWILFSLARYFKAFCRALWRFSFFRLQSIFYRTRSWSRCLWVIQVFLRHLLSHKPMYLRDKTGFLLLQIKNTAGFSTEESYFLLKNVWMTSLFDAARSFPAVS